MTGPVRSRASMHIGAVIVDRDLYQPNPLRHFRSLVCSVGRERELGKYLTMSGSHGRQETNRIATMYIFLIRSPPADFEAPALNH